MQERKPKLIRLTTVPISMNIILRGQLAHMNQYFDVIGVTGYDEKHFHECGEREGIRMHAIEMSRTISILRDLLALWKLYAFFRKEKPAIVHSHTPKAGLLGMLAAYFARVPIRLHTVGGMPLLEVTGRKRSILNFAERLTYACAHKIYPNSTGLEKIIEELDFCDKSKLSVIANGGSNGIDIDRFRPDYAGGTEQNIYNDRANLKIDRDALVFCFVGRIAKEKGIEELVTAFTSLRNSLPDKKMKLLLIGPFEKAYGILDDKVKDQITSDRDVLAPGRFDDVRPYYLLSDVYVFPSYREGFPNTLLEAGAMGLPSIVSNINGCNEIVEDYVNGLIIPAKDTTALYNAMLQMTDDSRRKAIAAKARTVIAAKFGREIVWKGLLEEYRSFLKDHPHASA
jgi:glycosyltransferase involved in cell wall biosynthesis